MCSPALCVIICIKINKAHNTDHLACVLTCEPPLTLATSLKSFFAWFATVATVTRQCVNRIGQFRQPRHCACDDHLNLAKFKQLNAQHARAHQAPRNRALKFRNHWKLCKTFEDVPKNLQSRYNIMFVGINFNSVYNIRTFALRSDRGFNFSWWFGWESCFSSKNNCLQFPLNLKNKKSYFSGDILGDVALISAACRRFSSSCFRCISFSSNCNRKIRSNDMMNKKKSKGTIPRKKKHDMLVRKNRLIVGNRKKTNGSTVQFKMHIKCFRSVKRNFANHFKFHQFGELRFKIFRIYKPTPAFVRLSHLQPRFVLPSSNFKLFFEHKTM